MHRWTGGSRVRADARRSGSSDLRLSKADVQSLASSSSSTVSRTNRSVRRKTSLDVSALLQESTGGPVNPLLDGRVSVEYPRIPHRQRPAVESAVVRRSLPYPAADLFCDEKQNGFVTPALDIVPPPPAIELEPPFLAPLFTSNEWENGDFPVPLSGAGPLDWSCPFHHPVTDVDWEALTAMQQP